MRNPWLDLPESAPFVLECDRGAVDEFNRTATPETLLHLELLPEPYIGNRDAPVVLLSLNPGYSREDLTAHDQVYFTRLVRANLVHEPADYPFYFLDPQCPAPGRQWWSSRLAPLIHDVGLAAVTRGVLCIEYFPYASRSYRRMKETLSSQDYGFWLARRAIKRGAVIILMRGSAGWLQAVPELAGYENLHRLKSVQNVVVSRRNCPTGFDRAVGALRARGTR